MQKITKNLRQYISLLNCVLLIICGIVCFCNSHNTRLISIIVAIFLLVVSILEFVLLFTTHQDLFDGRFILINAIITLLVSFVLFVFQDGTLYFAFNCLGFYILILGFSKIIHAIILNKINRNTKKFCISVVEGALLILAGSICLCLDVFFFPLLNNSALVIAIGIYLVFLGLLKLFDVYKDYFINKSNNAKHKNEFDKKVVIDTEIVDHRDNEK